MGLIHETFELLKCLNNLTVKFSCNCFIVKCVNVDEFQSITNSMHIKVVIMELKKIENNNNLKKQSTRK